MPDWTQSMKQSFEFYEVDPSTWKDIRKLDYMTSCSINRDLDKDTLGSASIECTSIPEECYVRTYLITIQNEIKETFPLGTHLIQTPSKSFDGKTSNISVDAYTPLIELKEDMPDYGYTILAGENIMDRVCDLTEEHLRAPVVRTKNIKKLYSNFVANTNDKWLSFNVDLMANVDYRYDLDEYGRVLFSPKQDSTTLQPVWIYDDNNSSILYPSISYKRDLYGIPNVVEVIYTSASEFRVITVKNEDPGSPTSIQNRGRVIKYRETNPSIGGYPSEGILQQYAQQVLESMSTVEVTLSYKHGYCPVRIGDCVLLNYKRAGIINTKAQVISQDIECKTGCTVSETAVFKQKLYGG